MAKYLRFLAHSGGSIIDDRWAYEVAPGKIVAYKVQSSGFFFWKTVTYEIAGEMQLQGDASVELWCSVPPGSGMCKVTSGPKEWDYHIYGSAEEFVREVQHEISRAR